MGELLWRDPAFIDIYSGPLSDSTYSTESRVENFANRAAGMGKSLLGGLAANLTEIVPVKLRSGLRALQEVSDMKDALSGAITGNGSSSAALDGLRAALQLVLRGLLDAEASELGIEADDAAVQLAATALRGAVAFAAELPVGSRDARKAVDFVAALVSRLEQLPPAGSMLVPAGWLGDEPDAPPSLLLLSVARRIDGGGYDVWVCNAGDGLQYHAVRASDRMGSLRVNAPARLPSVSEERASSAAFWFLLLRPLIWPCGAAASRTAVYEQLLPFLTLAPLVSRVGPEEAAWVPPPSAATAAGCGGLAMQALHALLRAGGLDGGAARHVEITLHAQLMARATSPDPLPTLSRARAAIPRAPAP